MKKKTLLSLLTIILLISLTGCTKVKQTLTCTKKEDIETQKAVMKFDDKNKVIDYNHNIEYEAGTKDIAKMFKNELENQLNQIDSKIFDYKIRINGSKVIVNMSIHALTSTTVKNLIFGENNEIDKLDNFNALKNEYEKNNFKCVTTK